VSVIANSKARPRFGVDRAQLKAMAGLAVPLVLAALLQNTYQLVDALWLGRLGAKAMASVAISMPVSAVLVALGSGFAVAASTMISQFAGQERQDLIRRAAAQALILSFAASLVIVVLGVFIAPYAVRLLGAERDIAPAAAAFLQVTMAGVIFTFNFAVAQAILRGRRLVRDALTIVAASVALNAALAPVLIFGLLGVPAMGVMGAAWSTLFAQAVAAVLSTALLFHERRGVNLSFADFAFDRELSRRMLRIGLPASVEQSVSQFNFVMMTTLVAHFGAQALATYGIGIRILIFAAVPSMGVSLSTAVLVGGALGAGKPEAASDAARFGARVGFAAGAIEGLLIFLCADLIGMAFAPGQPGLQHEVATYLRIAAFSYAAMAYNGGMAGAYRGAGSTRTAMLLIMCQSWLFQLPTAYALSHFTPLAAHGIWFSTPIANNITLVVTTLIFMSGRWRKSAV
jgi:putative MATE family efflux protein